MKAFRRTILIGIALLLLTACVEIPALDGSLGAGEGGGGPKPRPVETAAPDAWLTYVSNEFGFALDYPPYLSVVENRGDDDHFLLLRVRLLGPEASDPVLREHGPGEFALEVFANPEELELRAWLDTHGWPFGKKPDTASSIEIGGKPALEITTGRMLAPNRYIYLSLNGTVIRMAPIGPQSARILNSFRLL